MNCQVNGSANSTKSTRQKSDTERSSALKSRDWRLKLKLSIICAATIFGGSASAAKQQNGQVYQQVLQAQIKSEVYTHLLKTKMEAVARDLNRYYDRHGRLPEAGAECERLESKLSATAGNNACCDEKISTTPVKIIIDMSLSSVSLQAYQRLDSRYVKTDRPGTITIIHNTENFYAIAGYGIDGRPITTEHGKEFLLLTPGETLSQPQ